SDFEQAPSDVVLDAFEPGLLDSLLALMDDQSLPRLVRLRALHALGRYPDQAPAFERLRHIALDVEGDPRMRLAAVGTLGHRLAGHPETVEILGRVLRDPDPGVRARAVRLLSHVGGERAQELLARHRVVEMHVVVRKALRAALESRLGGPLPPEGRLRPVRPQIRLQETGRPIEAAEDEEALR
ncbi:MAG: HEAT repeat domain-containing protein, partial [Myxococcota bacterium]